VPRLAVVGHTEWVTFAPVERLPRPGEIVHARGTWEAPGGGGGIVAVLLARLAGACDFLTAAADDDGLPAALEALGVRVHTASHPASRRIFTHLDAAGERTITVLGDRLDPRRDEALPWSDLARADACFFAAGDGGAARAARDARVLVATPRAGAVLRTVRPDALVWSAADPAEAAAAEDLDGALRVETLGADGGRWSAADGTAGTWAAAPVPGDPVDAFGCGDAFAAGLTFALAGDRRLEDALALAARCGAAALTGRGPYGAIDRIAAAASG
jgi:ribokinase